jgi:hypothetical protein
MRQTYPDIHASEYSWQDAKFDAMLQNNGPIEELNQAVDDQIWRLNWRVVSSRAQDQYADLVQH